MDDLLQFGQVQRGLLGVQIVDVTAELAEDRNLDVVQGVFVSRVNRGSAAAESGLEPGDVITAIDGHTVNSVSELQEWVARNRPGESVEVRFRRESEERQVKATLKNYEGEETSTKRKVEFEMEGAEFEDLSYRELTDLSLDGGVRIKHLEEGKWKAAGLAAGFVITHIDKVPVDNVEDLNRILAIKRGGMLVEGLATGGKRDLRAVDW
jgi:S1-C subfamily serine protease